MKPKNKVEVIKIGGSVLFDSFGSPEKESIEPLFNILGEMAGRVILVIGCGESMHKKVIAANLTDKPETDELGNELLQERRIEEFFYFYREIGIILENLAQLDTVGRLKPIHPACAFIKGSRGNTNNHEIVWFNRSMFDAQTELIPLTSGGVVFDREILFSAISSDTIAAFLACQFHASRLVLLTDTKGIYPSPNRPTTIAEISITDMGVYIIEGGMRDKLRRIKPAVEMGIPTFIASGQVDLAREILVAENSRNCTRVIS